MSIFHILRVFSMGHDFFSKLDSTFSSFGSNISVVLSLFTLSFEYVVAETISYHKCALYFSIRCRDHAHISLAKRDLRIPFSVYVYSLWEMFRYIGNALDFRPRGPWFESGRLQQFFFFIFFFFFDFSMIIKLKTDHLIRHHDELNF